MDPTFPTHPQPLTIPPSSHPHRQTLIILHGRGSFPEKFAPPLLHTTPTTTSSSSSNLQTAFPHAKLIFPTASRSRATIYKKSFTHQWFDCWHLEQYTQRQDLREIEIVGAGNVLLWGMSQGCAASLAAVLAWEGEAFAGVVGMCGWLPFGNLSDGEDSSEQKACIDSRARGVEFFREEIDMQDKKGMVFQKIPIFLGHGTEDEKVPIELGREAKRVLALLGADVEMKEYAELGHWYSEAMFDDIFRFLRERLNIS
ncbi:acyl- thioesterase protein [Rutstroemia sp. NJR-2017a BBW]|nr:acyl- thioesterase protein [Rutstroemia sp. NJR-2017a BBW]